MGIHGEAKVFQQPKVGCFKSYWCVLRREWMGCWGLLGVAGLIITSDDWDRSRKFPAFSTTIFFQVGSSSGRIYIDGGFGPYRICLLDSGRLGSVNPLFRVPPRGYSSLASGESVSTQQMNANWNYCYASTTSFSYCGLGNMHRVPLHPH